MIRRVTVDTAEVVQISDLTNQAYFGVELRGPTTRQLRDAEAPRDAPYQVRYRNRALGPVGGPLTPGSRLSLREGVWEAVDTPRELWLGRQIVGYAQEMHDITTLYPLSGTIQELDGTNVHDVILSAWSGSDEHNDTGEYTTRTAELPVEYESYIKLNRQIAVGDARWKFVSWRPDPTHAFVNAEVRLAK